MVTFFRRNAKPTTILTTGPFGLKEEQQLLLKFGEEDKLLLKLKHEENLSWHAIAERFELVLGKSYQKAALEDRFYRLRQLIFEFWEKQDDVSTIIDFGKLERDENDIIDTGQLEEQSDQSCQLSTCTVIEPPKSQLALVEIAKEPQSHLAKDVFPSISTSSTNNLQAIINGFETALETIGGNEPCDMGLKSIKEREDRVFLQYRTPVQYGQSVFQSFYSLQDDRTLNLKAIREHQELRDFEERHQLELVLDLFDPLPEGPKSKSSYRPFRLALFDMDSTLINEEVIDELARSISVYDEVSAITERAMNDPTFDFAASLNARVALLRGVPADIWTTLQKKVTIATGARELIVGLKENGIITGVISGGFVPMAEWLKAELGLDFAFANHLSTSPPTNEYNYRHLTGQLDLSNGKVIVTPEYKKATLIAEASKRGIPLEQTLSAGDGSNDLQMLGAAGLGIAWNAKPKTQELAPMRLNGETLAELLYLLGPGGRGERR